MWSARAISTAPRAWAIWRVVWMSSAEGTARPLGWLWASTTVEALTPMAVSTTFRMEIPVELVPPRPTSLQHRSLHLASRQSRNTVSVFLPKNLGTRYWAQLSRVGST